MFPNKLAKHFGANSEADSVEKLTLLDSQNVVICTQILNWEQLYSMAIPAFDLSNAYRWFAAELNNNLWARLDAGRWSADDAEQNIHAAHASCYHWLQVGNISHHARAECLVANVYVAAGFGESALRHALRCQELIEDSPYAFEDWDVAFAYDALARAYTLTGDVGEAEHYQQQAQAAWEAIVDEEDRAIFQK